MNNQQVRNSFAPTIASALSNYLEQSEGYNQYVQNNLDTEDCEIASYLDLRNQERLANPILTDFLKSIEPPYNCVEFKRLNLKETDDIIDPITASVINKPVTLNGMNFDFDTLDLLHPDAEGFRTNPYTRAKFKITEVIPNMTLHDCIKKQIRDADLKRRNLIYVLCMAASNNKIEELRNLLAGVDITFINDAYKNGFTALHYACQQGHIECAKLLLDAGANIGARAGKSGTVTPIKLLKKHNEQAADELLKYHLDFLTSKKEDPKALLQNAKLLLEGTVCPRNIKLALEKLERAGELGEEQGFLLCGDLYGDGLYDVNPDKALALKYYVKAFNECESGFAHLKILYIIMYNREISWDFIDARLFEELAKVSTLAREEFVPEAQYIYSKIVAMADTIKGVCGFNLDLKITSDIRQYITYLEYAAKGGYATAQEEWACLLFENELFDDAKHYAQLAADQGLDEGKKLVESCVEYEDKLAQLKEYEDKFAQLKKDYAKLR